MLPHVGFDTVGVTVPVVGADLHSSQWATYPAGYDSRYGPRLPSDPLDMDGLFRFRPQVKGLAHRRKVRVGGANVRVGLYERNYFGPDRPGISRPTAWVAHLEFEAPSVVGALDPLPPEEAPGLVDGLLWRLHETGVLTLWCPHSASPDEETPWLQGLHQECPGPACLLESAVVARADVALDASECDVPEYVELLMAYPQRGLKRKEPDSHGGWATSGQEGWYVSVYDRHHRTRGKVPKGTMRTEVDSSKRVLRQTGIKKPEDLHAANASVLFRAGAGWSGLLMRHGGEASAEERLAVYAGASRTRKERLLAFLDDPRGAQMSPATRRSYEALAKELLLVPGLPGGGVGGPVRHLSATKATQWVSDVEWGRRGPEYLWVDSV